MIDRTASDLADARLSRRRETRLRIVEAVATQFVGALAGQPADLLPIATDSFRKCVDALESIVEPTAEKE